MKIGIVGLGLIGASIAKALNNSGRYEIVGTDKNPDVVSKALNDGVIKSAGGIEECDVVFCCLHPEDTVKYLLGNNFKPGAILTDTCGVKRYVMNKVSKPLEERGYKFVGGHPMAGKEKSGYDNSDPDMFKGAHYILIKDADTDPMALSEISGLADDMGFKQITRSTAAEHDKEIAYTSQLAHVVSNAYVKNPMSTEQGFSAGSFEDMTRVAQLDNALWAELFIENSDYLCDEIDFLIENMNKIKEVIKQKNGRQLRAVLKEGSDIREKILEDRNK